MTAVLDALFAILGRINTIFSFLTVITGQTAKAAQENVPFHIDTITSEYLPILGDPTNGNAAIKAELDDVLSDLTSGIVYLHDAIINLTNGTTPVSLPIVPPSGYGSLGPTDVFNAVWNATNGSDIDTPYEYVQAGGLSNLSVGPTTGYRPDGGIVAYYYTQLDTAGVHASFYPVTDFATILMSDTLLTWLTRINPIATVFWWSGPGSMVGINGNSGDGPAQFITTIDDTDFQAIKATVLGGPLFNGLPLWPGADAVTLGTPVALALGVTITEPMEGVLIAITSVPAKQGNFSFDGVLSWRNIGALAFGSDSGQFEYPQTLGFESSVYCPKSMSTAASVVVRTTIGVTGTITPWIRTPVS